MRLPIVSLLAIVALSGCAGTQVDMVAETEAVRARGEAIVAAEVAQDTEAALAFYSEDVIVQPAGSPQIQGRQAVRELYSSFFDSGQIKHFEGITSHLEVSKAGDIAYEYGINRMTLEGPEGDLLDVGKNLAVWKKIDGEWYVSALSFSSDAPAPVPVQSQ
jgi:ketosteroid isomerase-like protein